MYNLYWICNKTYITERVNKNVFNKALGVNVVYLTDKEKLNQFL